MTDNYDKDYGYDIDADGDDTDNGDDNNNVNLPIIANAMAPINMIQVWIKSVHITAVKPPTVKNHAS